MHRDSFIAGAVAGLIGISALAFRENDAPYVVWAWAAGVTMAIAAFVAVRRHPQHPWSAFRMMVVGVAVGIAVHAILHAVLFGGSRTLWPFEIVLFLFFGTVPAVAATLLARVGR